MICALIIAALAFASANPITSDNKQPTHKLTHLCEKDLSYSCVAKHLSQVAGCKAPEVKHPVDSVKADELTVEYPYFNGTINIHENNFQGLAGAKIAAFFTNSETGNTVLSITFPTLVNSGRETLWYHKPATEDEEVDTAFKIEYTNFYITAQWKGIDKIKIGTARIYSAIESASMDLEADWPELFAYVAANPQSRAAAAVAMANNDTDTLLREVATLIGRSVAKKYWSDYLCANSS